MTWAIGSPISCVGLAFVGWIVRVLAFLLGDELPQFFGTVDDWTRVRMFGLPFAQVLKKAVYIVARLIGQLVFEPPVGVQISRKVNSQYFQFTGEGKAAYS
jgi:hypothetical protein